MAEVRQTPLAELIPYARNARTHSDAQVAQLAASIREYGFVNPVLVAEDGTLIAGHGRVLGARQLGLETVPTLTIGQDWSAAQRRAYALADNQLALKAGWDLELLRLELEDLQALDFDLALTGFDEDEVARMLAATDEADFPVLPDGDKEPFQQMTFTLHDTQAEQVQDALAQAKAVGPFVDSENENSNGNALARICETFLAHG